MGREPWSGDAFLFFSFLVRTIWYCSINSLLEMNWTFIHTWHNYDQLIICGLWQCCFVVDANDPAQGSAWSKPSQQKRIEAELIDPWIETCRCRCRIVGLWDFQILQVEAAPSECQTLPDIARRPRRVWANCAQKKSTWRLRSVWSYRLSRATGKVFAAVPFLAIWFDSHVTTWSLASALFGHVWPGKFSILCHRNGAWRDQWWYW